MITYEVKDGIEWTNLKYQRMSFSFRGHLSLEEAISQAEEMAVTF